MSSIIDTISLMRESIGAVSGKPPEKIHLGSATYAMLKADSDSEFVLRRDPERNAETVFGMEIVYVSNDPYALAIVQHQVQQALPL